MKQMWKELNEYRKQSPKTFWGGIAVMIAIFGILYTSLWGIAILQGRV